MNAVYGHAARADAVVPDAFPGTVSLLLCRAGERSVAVPIGVVIETMRPQPIDPIPGVPAYIAGVSLIRGEAVPVVDVAELLNGRSARVSRFVTIRMGDRIAAMAVSDVLGIKNVGHDVTTDLPPLLGDVDSGVIAGLGQLDGSLLLVLRQARLVPDDTWTTMDRPPAPTEQVTWS